MDTKGTLLLVGTAKGLFILQRGGGSDKWKLDGPHFAGRAVYSAFYDSRKGRNDLWAGPVSWHFGAELVKSTGAYERFHFFRERLNSLEKIC